jgi:peptide/nickel transport system substrate-binding protein
MRRTLVATAVATLLLTVSACGGSSGGGSGSGSSGTLSLATITPPTSFEPGAMAMGGPEDHYYQAVYDSLLELDDQGQPTADLATDWSYDAAGTTLSLTLRDGVTFTDGTAFDATAVKANLEHAKQGTGEAGNALKFVDHVDAVDATHANVVLSAPDPSLVDSLARSAGYMASPKALDSGDIKRNPVGTGPYELDQAKTTAGDTYVYTRNADYWDKDAYPYDEVDVKLLDDTTAALNALRSGQIQGIPGGSKDIVDGAKNAGLTVTTYENGTVEGVFLWDRAGSNTKALGDVRVRQAINYAMDRETIVKTVKGGMGTATDQLFGPSTAGYDKSLEDVYPYDVDKAKQLMAEAGYADGFSMTLPDFSPVYPDEQAAMTEALQSIGITVTYQPVTPDQVVGSIIGGQWPANFFSLTSSNPWAFAQLAVAQGAPFNPFHVSDPKVTELLGTIQSSSGDAQDQATQDLNKYLVDQAWFAPWDFQKGAYVTSKDVKVTPIPGIAVPPLSSLAPAS